MEDKENNTKDEYITINVDDTNINTEDVKVSSTTPSNRRGRRSEENEKGRRTARINNEKKDKKHKKEKKKWSKKKKIIFWSIIFGIILSIGVVFGTYIYKAGGNVKEAVLNVATDIVGEQDPIFVLVLGISEDISVELTDTIMLCGYNPSTQKAFMLSIPRDTFVGKNPNSANGYDKINAQYQKSAEKTVEAVELLTGINIDHYVIVRNISITSIFECIGDVEFDVPINMNYDDPTQDLHIHLKKGYQTLTPDQVEQLLRFRHNNDGSSYPSSYGDNDYGRMRTQREFLAAVVDQLSSLENVGKLKDIASMVYTNLQTNMSGFKVLDYVPYGLKFSTSNLRSEQLPGKSALINQLWFYTASKVETRALMDELMIYLEMEDDDLESHYKYASSIKGIKPDQDYEVKDDVEEDDVYKNSNTTKKDTNVDQNTCKHQYAISESVDPTCTKKGKITKICTICGKEYNEAPDALGHNYQNGKCTRCGVADPANSNNNKNNNDNNKNDNNKDDKNKNENNNDTTNNKPAHTHKYSEKITTQATCTKAGVKTYTCSCGHSYTEAIGALGHNYQNGVCSKCNAKDPNYKEPEPEPKPEPEPNPKPTEPTDPDPTTPVEPENPNPDQKPDTSSSGTGTKVTE